MYINTKNSSITEAFRNTLRQDVSTTQLILQMLFVFFIVTSGTYANDKKDNTVISQNCGISIDIKDQTICAGEEVTLSALQTGSASCTECIAYGVENTTFCNRTNIKYVLFLKDLKEDISRYYRNENLKWELLDDVTVRLSGNVIDNNTDEKFKLDVTFTDKTTKGDDPKDNRCNPVDTSEWVYYKEFTGTIEAIDGSWKTTISRRGPAFQVGNGANETELIKAKYGASGWFDTTDKEFTIGDININLGDCIENEGGAEGFEYLWSNGATTPTISVTPEETTAYSVEVYSKCEDCKDTATVTITVGAIEVDAGPNQTICRGESATLIATGVSGSGRYEWSTGETTATITVTPDETTTYTVTATTGECTATSDVTVTIDDFGFSCGGPTGKQSIESLKMYPIPADKAAPFQVKLMSAIDQRLQLDVYDASGNLITKIQKAAINQGENIISVATEKLSSGVYFIKVIGENGDDNIQKIVIQ